MVPHFQAILIALGIAAAGYVVIWLLGLRLPPSRSFREYFLRIFWIYPASIDRGQIVANKIAWFIVAFVIFVVVAAIFIR